MQSAGANSNTTNNLLLNFSRPLNEKILLLQVLVGIFLYINCLMIFTFLKKEVFREETRYILFAQTLFVDSALMLLTDLLSVGTYFEYAMHMISCSIICTVLTFLSCCTPLTLVAMCLERYVAICMPLRHADISTTRTRLYGLFIIWSISSIIPVFNFIGYWAVVPPAQSSYAVCAVELMLGEAWQAYGRAIFFIILFLFLIIIIVFTYIKIMIAARAASSEKMKSTNKSLRTVLLHAFQLFLCIIQFLNPYIVMAYWKVEEMMLRNIKYSMFIVCMIAPRCLSPLIYGLRDEKFFHVLRHYAMCGSDCLFSTLLEIKQLKIRPTLDIIK
ncbi:odorant receptor 131-2-like [Pangasianodon hypophthalmus]|uniref:odorant receptor 131-2-like n=1 Tax=Pangasianodon hypophthalmus TaxID=310915 RepID=UPI000EFE0CDB|nr:odorant receptor 131-2-like [Pangasianodon hypophthalmus]